MFELTEQQQQVLRTATWPVRVEDPQTRQVYVILPAAVYERVRSLFDENYELSDTYAAQMESAMRAGWADPVMDEYNDYDAHRKP